MDDLDDLDDELDLRYHRGLKPDVYYRAPNTESLDGAIRNELERNAWGLIPSHIVTEFVFAATSTITVPVTQQPHLDALIVPQDYAQSIRVEYALCRDLDGKDRLKIQRTISKSIIAAIEDADGFKYSERHAYNPKVGGDGARLRYVCQDSLENRDRKVNGKRKGTDAEYNTSTKANKGMLPTYDCGGAIHIKFSIKREAINVVYKHNPIHRNCESRLNGNSEPGDLEANGGPAADAIESSSNATKKRKSSKKEQRVAVPVTDGTYHSNLDMSTSPEAPKTSVKRSCKSIDTANPAETTKRSKTKKVNTSNSAKDSTSTKSKKKAALEEHLPSPPRLARNKACVRCREKKTKCNQCRRGLWTCQYKVVTPKHMQRSKNGCLNCKQRKRKCIEEKPSCAYCLKVDDDCEYAEYS